MLIYYFYYRIDQLAPEDDIGHSYRQINLMKKISETNYVKSLTKCYKILHEILYNYKRDGKTSVIEDINELKKKHKTLSRVNSEILQFSISQKKLINYHQKMFVNRLIKEVNKDIWGKYKGDYI